MHECARALACKYKCVSVREQVCVRVCVSVSVNVRECEFESA